jgi:hypothetical protein
MNGMKEWDNVNIVDKGFCYKDFIFVPYVFPGRFVEALELITKDWKSYRAIFCHQEFYGCKMGAITSEIGDKWDIDNPMIISGHIHDKQRIQDNIFYSGSSMQHAFGETHDKTISLCDFDDNITLYGLDLGLTKKKILYMDLDETKEFNIGETKDKIRITLQTTQQEFKVFRKSKKYKELVNDGVKIVHKNIYVDHKENIKEKNDDFHENLLNIIKDENNTYMMDLYKELMLS